MHVYRTQGNTIAVESAPLAPRTSRAETRSDSAVSAGSRSPMPPLLRTTFTLLIWWCGWYSDKFNKVAKSHKN